MSAVLPKSMTQGSDFADEQTVGASEGARVNASVPLSAVDKLIASRAKLRGAMMEIAHPPPKPKTAFSDGAGHLGSMLMGRLRAVPGAAILVDSVQTWWDRHPLRAAGAVAEEATRTFVAPVARQRPYALIGIAAVAGAMLALTRPWRWLIRPALFIGLVPQILAHTLKRMPASAWLAMLGKVGRASSPRAAPRNATRAAKTPPL